nr:hypothetical protein [Tanacetum cinerariifolium]
DDLHRALKDKGIVDNRCSRHMTGNKTHLADYQEFKGGFVAFGKIEAINVDEGITLVDVEKDEEVVDIDVVPRESLNQEDVSAVEPTVFDDEEVTMIIDQTLIKLKARKVKLLDEQIAQKLHDEEVQKAAARDKEEKADTERAIEL